MSRQFRNDLKSSLIIPVGWLFADLLLAVAMLFLAANTIGAAKPKPTPTPVIAMPDPTPKVTVSPTPIPRILESTYCEIQLNVDPNGLLNSSPSAIQNVKDQLMGPQGPSFLKGRRAGLAIAYGGAPTTSGISTAIGIAKQIYKVLDMLGGQKFVFIRTSYFDPLYVLGNDPSVVELDVYLLVRPNHPGDTCSSNHNPL